MPAIATTVSTTVLKSAPLFASFPDEQLRTLVSRVMKDLQMGGYIETRGSSIVLHDTILLRD